MPAIEEKILKTSYPSALNLEKNSCVSGIAKSHDTTKMSFLLYKKSLVWHWYLLIQCNVTGKNQFLFLSSLFFISNSVGKGRGSKLVKN